MRFDDCHDGIAMRKIAEIGVRNRGDRERRNEARIETIGAVEMRDGAAKVSFRASRMNVAKIAEQFGGGGHKPAAGATVPGPYEAARDRVLAAVEAAVNES